MIDNDQKISINFWNKKITSNITSKCGKNSGKKKYFGGKN